MQIVATITYAEGDDLSMTTQELADAFLNAAHGDEKKDHCSVTIFVPAATSGTPPAGEVPTGTTYAGPPPS
jgi:hypothetical protein